jgi:hypothetical protein
MWEHTNLPARKRITSVLVCLLQARVDPQAKESPQGVWREIVTLYFDVFLGSFSTLIVTLYVAVEEPWEAQQVQYRSDVDEDGTSIHPGLITTHSLRHCAALVAQYVREISEEGLSPGNVIQRLLHVRHINNIIIIIIVIITHCLCPLTSC